MGNRWSITSWRALSDQNAEEREYLTRVLDAVYPHPIDAGTGNRRLVEGDWKAWMRLRDDENPLRRKWGGSRVALWDGEIFVEFFVGERIGRNPFPEVWHALFDAPGRWSEGGDIFVRVDEARRHFADAFAGLLTLLTGLSLDGWTRDTNLPEPGSEGWVALRKALNLFDPYHYADAVHLLAEPHSPSTLLEGNFWDIVGMTYDDLAYNESRRAEFLRRGTEASRLLDMIARKDFAALARDDTVRQADEEASEIVRWLTLAPHRDRRPFAEYSLTEMEIDSYMSVIY